MPDATLGDLVSTFLDEARELTMRSERDIACFVSVRLLCPEFYSMHAQTFQQRVGKHTDLEKRSQFIVDFLNDAIVAASKKHV